MYFLLFCTLFESMLYLLIFDGMNLRSLRNAETEFLEEGSKFVAWEDGGGFGERAAASARWWIRAEAAGH